MTNSTHSDAAETAAWLEEYQAQAWDEQIAQDERVGRFEPLNQRAREQFKAGQCCTLWPAFDNEPPFYPRLLGAVPRAAG